MKSEVFNADCLEAMKQYPKNYFDLAIVDPPFGIGNFVQTGGNVRGEKVTWNEQTPSQEYFDELKRVSKHRIIFGANYYNMFAESNDRCLWAFRKDEYQLFQNASCSFHKKVEIYTQTWTNFVHAGRVGIHPCEMPIDIYRWILQTYCKQGDKILDTHLGSGSSRIAADMEGFQFTGYELDKDYFEASVKRFNEYKLQTKLL